MAEVGVAGLNAVGWRPGTTRGGCGGCGGNGNGSRPGSCSSGGMRAGAAAPAAVVVSARDAIATGTDRSDSTDALMPVAISTHAQRRQRIHETALGYAQRWRQCVWLSLRVVCRRSLSSACRCAVDFHLMGTSSRACCCAACRCSTRIAGSSGSRNSVGACVRQHRHRALPSLPHARRGVAVVVEQRLLSALTRCNRQSTGPAAG